MKRFLWLGFVLLTYMICTGCGDTFRPIIIPNPPVFPNPAASHSVLTLSDNGDFVPGTGMVIDVSGDTDVSIANTDIHPVHAVQPAANQVLVVNQAVTLAGTGENLGTTGCLVPFPAPPAIPQFYYDVCPSLTKLTFSGTTISSTTAISLPIYSSPNFVAVAPSATTAFVTLPTYPPDSTNPQAIVPSVAVVNTTENNVPPPTPVVYTAPGGTPVLSNPYALAVTVDNAKLYVANNSTPCSPPTAGICSISAFDIVTTSSIASLSTRGINGSLSSPPIWLSARSDSQAVYVLETSGTLAQISITSTSGPDTLTEYPAINVPGATKMVYDGNLNRLYISGGSEVEIVDVSQATPSIITTIPITAITPSSRSTGDPCQTTSVTTLNTVDVAALPDGSRAYIGTYYEDASDNICPQVTVIDARSYAITATIAIPGFAAYDAFCAAPVSQQGPRFRIMMAAGGDSTRAYLSSCDGGMVNIIDTSSDTYILNQPAPVGTRPPIPPNPLNPPQNPVFMIAGP